MIRASDIAFALVIAFMTGGLYFFGIDALEFYRHTEADRTLIAWEMVETKNYLVPHLLHTPILTKPPLYYWILAFFISLFGIAAEWVVRFPSVICAGAFAGAQFLLLRGVGFSRSWCAAGSVMLATGPAFQEFATLAEIDTLLGFLSGTAFGVGFLAVERRSFLLSILTGLLLGLTFLAKGPPTLVFFTLGLSVFLLWARMYPQASSMSRSDLYRILRNFVLGLLIGGVPVFIWLWKLSEFIGGDALRSQFRVEILQRALSDNAHPRGPFFYLVTVALCLLPWTLGIVAASVKAIREHTFSAFKNPGANRFLLWNVCILLPSLLLLSFSTGKSNRYLFPLYGVLANICLYSFWSIKDSLVERYLFFWGRVVVLAAMITGILLPVYVRVNGVPQQFLWLMSVAGFFMLAGLFYALFKGARREVMVSVCLLALLFQVGKVKVFAPQRNAQRSVKDVAAQVNFLVPKPQAIFTVELFDRWVNYYLKRLGRESFRLTPAFAEEMRRENAGTQYLLLDTEHETWRLEKLKALDPNAEVLRTFRKMKTGYILVRVNGARLHELKLQENFPTVPTPPE